MGKTVIFGKFEWDEEKDEHNQTTHGLAFKDAIQVFLDESRILAQDELHSAKEERTFCIGLVDNQVATVRFTMRGDRIRIIGAGYWRKGKRFYEKNKS